MKKLLAIVVLGLIWGASANAFFSSAAFKKDRELNFNHFFNFDISKYKFQDHESIIGDEFEKWNGDPKKKSESEKDYKRINVLIDGKKQEMRLREFKNNRLWLQVYMKGYTCDEAKNKIPERFINKQNYQEYISDFYFMKMKEIKFSYDNKNSRIHFGCMQSSSDTKNIDSFNKKDALVSLVVSKKDDPSRPKVVPFKGITCTLDEGKSNLENKWKKMKSNSKIDFYILDDTKKLFNEKNITAGENKVFNNDKIHTIQKYEYKKDQKITFYKEYLINRVNGNFSYKKKSYDPNPDLKKYLGIKDGIIVVDYVGTCSKRTELRKF